MVGTCSGHVRTTHNPAITSNHVLCASNSLAMFAAESFWFTGIPLASAKFTTNARTQGTPATHAHRSHALLEVRVAVTTRSFPVRVAGKRGRTTKRASHQGRPASLTSPTGNGGHFQRDHAWRLPFAWPLQNQIWPLQNQMRPRSAEPGHRLPTAPLDAISDSIIAA